MGNDDRYSGSGTSRVRPYSEGKKMSISKENIAGHEKYRTYDAFSYDVWGNDKDGYEVNGVYPEEKGIVIESGVSDDDIKRTAKKVFSLKPGIKLSSIEIDGEDDYTLYFNYSTSTKFIPIGEFRHVKTSATMNFSENPTFETVDELIQHISDSFHDDPDIVKFVEKTESGVRTTQGNYGRYMQFMSQMTSNLPTKNRGPFVRGLGEALKRAGADTYGVDWAVKLMLGGYA